MPAAGSEEGAAGAGGEGAGPGGASVREQAGPGTPKLCGYLQKLSGKGPLRGFRSRWFVFDPRRCYLYYFKGPQEALPLGYLDIASACFSYHQPETGAAAGDEAAAFEVHSPNGTVAVLKVGPRCPGLAPGRRAAGGGGQPAAGGSRRRGAAGGGGSWLRGVAVPAVPRDPGASPVPALAGVRFAAGHVAFPKALQGSGRGAVDGEYRANSSLGFVCVFLL